jgi:predicted enzyme related to lactoylglutathione lyase
MSNPVTWFEVHTPDPDRSKAFYRDAFGWTFDDSMPGYSMIAAGTDAPIGGGIAALEPGQRPMAVFNVQVEDVAAACDRVGKVGGTVVVGKQSTPFGLDFAYVSDPDGNTFGVWTPPPAS